MKRRTVLSLEQALSMPYATLRFAQLGWRVIRIEATPSGRGLPGDPNRHIGARVVDDDRHSYYIAPNAGKEAIVLNLKEAEGRDVLHRIVRELEVDVFCCNTLPGRYKPFGIDYEILSAIRPQLIWAGISAMGPDYPDIPGYDPAIQAMAGFMELTGDPQGPPTLSGIPLIDLKAGDEVYAGVCLALAELAESGRGQAIHVSMLQAAASWLITTLPLIDFGCDPEEITRWGNKHRKFIPTNAYPTSDGFVYIAIGNDIQWQRLVELPTFRSAATESRTTNRGRYAEVERIYTDLATITCQYTTEKLSAWFAKAMIPHAPINTVTQVQALEALRTKLTSTTTPDGKRIRMQPLAVDHPDAVSDLAFPPGYGSQTGKVLAEAGFDRNARAALSERGIIHLG